MNSEITQNQQLGQRSKCQLYLRWNPAYSFHQRIVDDIEDGFVCVHLRWWRKLFGRWGVVVGAVEEVVTFFLWVSEPFYSETNSSSAGQIYICDFDMTAVLSWMVQKQVLWPTRNKEKGEQKNTEVEIFPGRKRNPPGILEFQDS